MMGQTQLHAGDGLVSSEHGMALWPGHSWDVFAGEHAAGGLWLAWGLAQQLAERGAKVRLFSERVDLLAQRVAGVQSGLVWQQFAGMTVCDGARAADVWPARTALQILGAPMPGSYLQRLLNSPFCSRWMQLDSPDGGRASTTPLTPLEAHLDCQSFLVQVGDAPSRGGYLRQPIPSSTADRPEAAFLASTRQAWLARLGSDDPGLLDRFTIYVDASAAALIQPLLDLWRFIQAEFIIVVERPEAASASHDDIVLAMRGARKLDVFAGVPQVVELPLWPWADTTLLLRSADLAVMGDPMSCIRAASLGVPVLPLLPQSVDDDALVSWYCQGSPTAVAEPLRQLAQCVGDAVDLQNQWTAYRCQWSACVTHARSVAQRIANGPDLVETMLQPQRTQVQPRHRTPAD